MRAKLVNESRFKGPSDESIKEATMLSIKKGFNTTLGEFRPLKIKSLTPHSTDMPGSDDFLVLYKVTNAADLIFFYEEEGKSLSRLTDILLDEVEDYELGALNDEPYDIGEIKRIINIDEENETVTLVMSLILDRRVNAKTTNPDDIIS